MFHGHDGVRHQSGLVQRPEQLIVPLEIVRRIGVHEIERAGDGDRSIRKDRLDVHPKRFGMFRNRCEIPVRGIDGSCRPRPARERLERENSAPGKQIEKPSAVNSVSNDVEVGLAGALRRRPYLAAGKRNASSAKSSCSDAEIIQPAARRSSCRDL